MNRMNEITNLPIWAADAPLRCVERREETQDCATFVLAPDAAVRFDYHPGQFVLVNVEIEGSKHYRAYSISSSPTRPLLLAITVKRLEGGLVSNWLLDNLHEGGSLEVGKPAGEFFLPPDNQTDEVVLLSTGSGITPVMSMSRWLLDSGRKTRIRFIHSARDEENVIFRRELEEMAKKHPNFELHLVLSRSSKSGSGRLTDERLAELVPDPTKVQAYICGQQDYMDRVEGWLVARGLPKEHFYKESFTPVAAQEIAAGAALFKLEVPAYDKHVDIAAGQTLLDAMEKADLPIIGACRSGVCGSCKCKVTAGTVESSSLETLTQDEIDNGYVLACSTMAKSDLSVGF